MKELPCKEGRVGKNCVHKIKPGPWGMLLRIFEAGWEGMESTCYQLLKTSSHKGQKTLKGRSKRELEREGA